MKSWNKLLISSSQNVLGAIKIINDYCQFGVVVNEKSQILGTVTDGDIRRGILRGLDINTAPVTEIMNKNPVVFEDHFSPAQIHNELKNLDSKITFIPLINSQRVVTNIYSVVDEGEESNSKIPVVIMAGGLGSRLGEMTKSCPKPLLKINGVPILELIISHLKRYKFKKIYISVNYMSEMIEDYFKNGSNFDVEIHYIRESKKLGTAGCLSMVDFDCDRVVVMNGDVLTQVNFQGLLDFHLANNSSATMCVREHSYTIPYGVIREKDGKIIDIDEKPTASVFVNAGIYVLDKSILQLIPNDEYYDMPTLFKKIMGSSSPAMVYPVHEYWTDIGHKEDFKKAEEDFSKVFSE